MNDLSDFFKLVSSAPKEQPKPVIEEQAEQVVLPVVEDSDYTLAEFFSFISENKTPEEKIEIDAKLLNSFFATVASGPKRPKFRPKIEIPSIAAPVSEDVEIKKESLSGFFDLVGSIKDKIDELSLPETSRVEEFEEPLKHFNIVVPEVVSPDPITERPFIVSVRLDKQTFIFEFSDGHNQKITIPKQASTNQPIYVAGGGDSGGGGDSFYQSMLEGGYTGTEQQLVSEIIELTTNYIEEVDMVSDYIFYKGRAVEGTSEDSPEWKISKIVIDEMTDEIQTLFADGNQNYDNIWSARATLAYA